MGKRALFICFIPAVIAGLFMGLFINYFPTIVSWNGGVNASAGDANSTKQAGGELNTLLAGDNGSWLIAFVFILMILAVLRIVFGVKLAYLVSALFSYMGMVLIVGGPSFIGWMYLFFGGAFSLVSMD